MLVSGDTESPDEFYAGWELKLLSNPAVSQELADTGGVRLKTLQREFDVSEGEAALLSRALMRIHGDKAKFYSSPSKEWQEQATADRDGYLYHITTKRRLRSIMKQGLVPGSQPHFTNYGGYSSDRLFLTEKGGVPFWKERVEQHEHSNYDRPSKVVVLRVPRDQVDKLISDKIGTQDSLHPSYYTEQLIPPSSLELV
jgi:hypothetical protein